MVMNVTSTGVLYELVASQRDFKRGIWEQCVEAGADPEYSRREYEKWKSAASELEELRNERDNLLLVCEDLLYGLDDDWANDDFGKEVIAYAESMINKGEK